MSYTALETYLKPLDSIFVEDGVTEISINQPREVWVEKRGDITQRNIEELDFNHLKALVKLVAQATDQDVSEERPLLSATLPNGYRIQVVLPPAAETGTVVISIRKPSATQLTLDDYEKLGAFNVVKTTTQEQDQVTTKLMQLLKEKEIKEFLKYAIASRKNIIVSGGTSTGKTTFTNAILQEIDSSERIITVEDAREIILSTHPNKIHLIASRGDQGRAQVNTQDLIEACLRLRPDRIIVGELRGKEAFSFLRAINTGHPGSASTLHADTPMMAIEQLKLMVMQAGLGIPPEQVREYIINVVDIIIQLKREAAGRRFVSEILLTKTILTHKAA